MVSKNAETREEEYPPERCLQDVLDDLVTGDHVIVVLIKDGEDAILPYDVRWSGGVNRRQLGAAADAITESIGNTEL